MFHTNSRCSVTVKLPPKTADRVTKICYLLGRALGEVHTENIKAGRSPSSSPCKRRSDQSSQSQTIQQILTNLRKGYLMVKHSQKIDEPHNKFVYLSDDTRFLCWKSLDKEDQKQLQLSSVTKVIKEGAQFYLKSNKIKDISRCLVVLSPSRNLQLQSASEMDAEYFKYELDRAIKYSKGMRLNYKYSQS